MRSRLAFSAVLVLLATGLATPAQAAYAPEWKQVFTTDFAGSKLPGKCFSYGGPHGGPADSYYTSDQVNVSGGYLRLGIEKKPSDGRNYATGGIGCNPLAQTYGRYEYRAKAPKGTGIDAYATLWPDTDGVGQHAALIEILAKPGNEKAYLSNEYGSGEGNKTVTGNFTDAFHTYVIEWTPGRFRILIDGQVKMDEAKSSNVKRWIGFAVSSGDPLTGVPDGNTPLPGEFQIDSLTVFSYQGNNAKPTPTTKAAVKPSPTRTSAAPSAAPTSAAATSAGVPPTGGPTSEAPAILAGQPTAADAAGTGWMWWAIGALLAAIGVGVMRLTVFRRPRGRRRSA